MLAAAPNVDAADEELAALAAMVSEHLAWEARLGGGVVPEGSYDEDAVVAEAAPVAVSAAPAPAPARVVTPAHDPSPAPAAARAPAPAHEPAAAPAHALPLDERRRRLDVLAAEAAVCTRCELHHGRTRSVFSRGAIDTTLAFVGEGPGYNEDQEGLPFVGPAGQLLDRMIGAMGFGRDEVYVCNVVKCRPPENRTPTGDEARACEVFLAPQLEIVAPRVIVALGRTAAENLGCAEPGQAWRGSWGSWRGIPVMPTYHPAFLLRSPEMKKPVWEDLQKVLVRLGRTAPPSRKG